MKIMKTLEFDMGHCVPSQADAKNKPGPCTSYHGHRYRIIVAVDDKVLGDNERNGGMVIDFRDLKRIMMETIHNKYDHSFILWEQDLTASLFLQLAQLKPYPERHFTVSYVPTAENLARHWFQELDKALIQEAGINLLSLEVFETPTSSALYTRDNDKETLR